MVTVASLLLYRLIWRDVPIDRCDLVGRWQSEAALLELSASGSFRIENWPADVVFGSTQEDRSVDAVGSWVFDDQNYASPVSMDFRSLGVAIRVDKEWFGDLLVLSVTGGTVDDPGRTLRLHYEVNSTSMRTGCERLIGDIDPAFTRKTAPGVFFARTDPTATPHTSPNARTA
ncbi:hypothetical protein ACEXQB_012395 [Herbiconiux sp. P18]|uniref:hypothetical protein n=1 Tax=Herbiconiux liangxiaofengii TaxID=3342795 RepID=UPI0035BB9612